MNDPPNSFDDSKHCTVHWRKILNVNKSDDELFKDPPPKKECPICLLPMPYARPSVYGEVMTYMPCCGKILCCRCVESQTEEMINGKLKAWCPFCRVPLPNSLDEHVRRMLKRIQMNDAEAASRLGFAYSLGDWGLQQDTNKALELWNRAAELGSSSAHSSIADAYHYGQGVEKDMNKAIQHWKIAARMVIVQLGTILEFLRTTEATRILR